MVHRLCCRCRCRCPWRRRGRRVGTAFRRGSTDSGFTLVELVLATFISGLVIALVSAALSFSLRLWERNQYRNPAGGPQLLELLSLQIGSFYPFPVQFDEGQRALFIGTADSLLLATGYSVRALSRGAPVLARYVYVQPEQKIYYAEMPLDPYHPERIKDFLSASPGSGDRNAVRFFAVEAADWGFGFWDSEAEDYAEQWQNPNGLPILVRVTGAWEQNMPTWARVITLGFVFPEGNQVP